MMGRSARIVGAVTVLLMLAAACGDDSGGSGSSGEDGEYVDAIAEAMSADMSEEDLAAFGEDGIECMAAALVDSIGVDGLVELGLDLEAIQGGAEFDESVLSEEEADSVIDGIFACVDFGEVFAAQSGGAFSEDAANCLGDRMESSDTFRELMVQSMLGDESADPFDSADTAVQAEMIDMFTDCLSSEEIAQLGGLS